MASGLLWDEAGFRKTRHAEDLPRLAAAPGEEQLEPCVSSTK
jgi:hypothetical protein